MSSTTESYGTQEGRLADEIWVDFNIFKILYRLNYLDFTSLISVQFLIL